MQDSERIIIGVSPQEVSWRENLGPTEGCRLTSELGQDVSSTEKSQRMWGQMQRDRLGDERLNYFCSVASTFLHP